MAIDPLYIAFYGTLKSDNPNFKRLGLDRCLKFACECKIEGDLYDIHNKATGERYPALVSGSGTVIAQLYEIVDPSFLQDADKYEEYDEKDPEASLYIRKPISLLEPSVDAWVYVYNRPISDFPKVTSGVWSQYLQAQPAQNSGVFLPSPPISPISPIRPSL